MPAVSSTAAPGGTLSYVGNPDFRGYLAGLAANGDPMAQTALNFVGNDYTGGTTAASPGINKGAFLQYVQSPGNAQSDQQAQAAALQALSGYYGNYNALVNGGGGGGATGGTGSADAASYYQDVIDQLSNELNTTKAQEPVIVSNIDNAANKSTSDLNAQESAAESGFQLQHANNATQRAGNVAQINAGARGLYESLLSILGHAGAGVSSVASVTGPQAVAQDASGKLAGANTAFNSNESSIGSAEDQTKSQYKSALDDILTQANNQKGNALSSLLNEEAQLNQQIGAAQINKSMAGGGSYASAKAASGNTTSAINDIESRLSNIFSQYATPTFSVKPVTVTQPNLTSYSYDPSTIKTAGANPGTDQSFLPYLASLKQDPNSPSGILNLGATPKDQQLQPAGAVA